MEPITGGDHLELVKDAKGGQPLEFTMDGDTKVFDLTAKAVKWPILKDVIATAWTYNGTVPGPMIRVTDGDKVRIMLKNDLPQPTTIHWHGIAVPNAMDGIPDVTQKPIEPGETFTYEFVASPAGTYLYHSHFEGDVQVGAGLYAPFIIDPKETESVKPDVDVDLMISEMLIRDGQTYAAMPMAGMEPNYFTINGKAYPETETINVKRGQLVRLRLTAIGQFVHPIHLHGVPFKIVAPDGHPVPEAAQLTKDTVLVSPGERYDIEFIASEPGQWMLHCHILHHTTNDNVEPGGLMLMINVTG
jgi:FtsP/CotA-like multicopper oxidase with cupredoxin domain